MSQSEAAFEALGIVGRFILQYEFKGPALVEPAL